MSRPIQRPLAGFLPILLSLGCGNPEPHDGPRLMVMVVVDQLIPDLLERYDEHYSGGLRRLLDEGFRFDNAAHDHGVTETAAGHATISTGVYPKTHGIVANDWFEFDQAGEPRYVYAVADSLSPIVGIPERPGRSPRNLERGGMADWVLGADSGAHVVSVSKKDRAAVTMAGTAPGHVYWLDAEEGRYVTSTWYRQALPGWVEDFNREARTRFLSDSVWYSTIPAGLEQVVPRGDPAPYEADGIHTTFPHRFEEEEEGSSPSDFNEWIAERPMVDAATIELAMTSVRELGLGDDDIVDYLSVSLSQVDYVGHRYGPHSVEQFDTLLRLDRLLGEFLAFLDGEIGAGRWVLGFSADHGVQPVPEYLQELGQPGGRVGGRDFRAAARLVREALPDAAAAVSGPEQEQVAELLEQLDFVADALTQAELAGEPAADSLIRLQQNSYFAGRMPGPLHRYGVHLEIRLTPGTVEYTGGGTNHGSPYRHDRHVPLIFLGAGVQPGLSDGRVRTVDVAPTLAALAGIPVPADLAGRDLFR
jgi:predicted AlkP superfamily pyrophosphatase or phosphodiesterase